MGAAYFYHMTRNPLEAVLISLVEKSREAGWRVAVRGRSAEVIDRLDDILWLRPEDGFLPHGKAGGDHDAAQPVLLTTTADLPNAPDCLMSVEGAGVTPDEVARASRVCILFDGHDEAAVARARMQWKELTGAGCAAKYWSEASGRWELKSESGTGGAEGASG